MVRVRVDDDPLGLGLILHLQPRPSHPDARPPCRISDVADPSRLRIHLSRASGSWGSRRRRRNTQSVPRRDGHDCMQDNADPCSSTSSGSSTMRIRTVCACTYPPNLQLPSWGKEVRTDSRAISLGARCCVVAVVRGHKFRPRLLGDDRFCDQRLNAHFSWVLP
jgi:hypothetical protein